MINLHHIDCMEYMARYPDNYFDLAIVDPPYGIRYAKKDNKKGLKIKFIEVKKIGIIAYLQKNIF
jgi:site-specific DNA-methyltransferase (adenine-specific)